ncbi:BMC domain-containing protein [Oceanirhabdus sp. W0125-5]|uniref:BMC domain-containing protein n=1 Tax=Oceanirhabdus sp. W0125-5 TaxID=2999116 RepID=UPI0022F33217|nr:BMC domain-containing protein [Oceanirhabdus sp. W0125-5]WBW94907.1 BMC domain-containing protein [Oceanirhabdus sp. W0125-5]
MNRSALGLVETYGYIGAVEALDVALKSANVKLLGCEYVKGGIVTIKITGDVAAVKSAVEGASIAAANIGNLISTHVIARVSDEVFKMIQKDFMIEELEWHACDEDIKNQIEIPNEEKEVLEEDFDKDEEIEIDREELQKMKVTEIRTLARKLEIKSMTKKEIKFGKKEELIEAILNHKERGDK